MSIGPSVLIHDAFFSVWLREGFLWYSLLVPQLDLVQLCHYVVWTPT